MVGNLLDKNIIICFKINKINLYVIFVIYFEKFNLWDEK